MHAQRYFVLFIRKIAIPLDKNCIFVYNNDKYCKLHKVFFAILTYNNEQMKTKKRKGGAQENAMGKPHDFLD